MTSNEKLKEHLPRIILVANPSEDHIGAHLLFGAKALGAHATIADVRSAFEGSRWRQQLSWHLLGHRPIRLNEFVQHVLWICENDRPELLIATGIAPLTADALKKIKCMGIKCINYLTDDPWNPANAARHFWKAMLEYDAIFSPRRANMEDLVRYGCKEVVYLPFAYSPVLHFTEKLISDEDQAKFACDVSFIGGADADRFPYIYAIAKAGIDLKLYGGYWQRYAEVRRYYRGFVLQSDLRKAVAGSKVSLCMVRRANRDGHAMRSYEFPSMGACMLVENTDEHRELYGQDGDAVCYFKNIREMLEKLRWLLSHEEERSRMANTVREIITEGSNTYTDRLTFILRQIIK